MRPRDQDAGHGNAGKKRLGAVQRIQHPHELGVFAHRGVLLAGDTVIGVGALDKLSQTTLGLAVGLRDRAAVRLDIDRQWPAEVTAMDLAGRIGKPIGELDELDGAVFQGGHPER